MKGEDGISPSAFYFPPSLFSRSHIRKDPIVDRCVIVSANRAGRPGAFLASRLRGQEASCPFCEGQEQETPGEVLAWRESGSAANGPRWRVRVVPNKFPALEVRETDPCKCSAEGASDGLYHVVPGFGTHEVIIESPRHVASTADLSVTEAAEVFLAYRQRLLDLRHDRRLVQPVILKNVGEAAGASIEHTHSQLIVTPMVPTLIREELAGSLNFRRTRGRCVYCEMLRQELESRQRIVLDSRDFAAITPFAGRFPFETWVLPKAHASHYECMDLAVVKDLAAVVRGVITKMEAVLDRPAYNYLIHTAPFDSFDLDYYHWHVEIVPVLTRMAGFELGSGYYINPVPPEEAAARLRETGLEF